MSIRPGLPESLQDAGYGITEVATQDSSPRTDGWQARLALGFARRGNRSVLVRNAHSGPLVVQKTLHPEGPEVCQAIVVHPPGGVAGGDELTLCVDIGSRAFAQLTTPGAAKWYRSTGAIARQTYTARIADGARLEWLPQETIVFDGARGQLQTTIALQGDAVYIGWDIVCLGRIASGERFTSGWYRQCFELVRDGALVWTERTIVHPGDALMSSPIGLNGAPMFGTLVAAAPKIADDVVAECRRIAGNAGDGIECAVTRMPGVLVARCRGHSAEILRRSFIALWSVLRPALCERKAMLPRIWNT